MRRSTVWRRDRKLEKCSCQDTRGRTQASCHSHAMTRNAGRMMSSHLLRSVLNSRDTFVSIRSTNPRRQCLLRSGANLPRNRASDNVSMASASCKSRRQSNRQRILSRALNSFWTAGVRKLVRCTLPAKVIVGREGGDRVLLYGYMKRMEDTPGLRRHSLLKCNEMVRANAAPLPPNAHHYSRGVFAVIMISQREEGRSCYAYF